MSTPRSVWSATTPAVRQFAGDVGYYLTLQPRQLPSRYFYDALGSALFEAICQLPWYGITRAELRLIHEHARAIFGRLEPSTLVELGPGNGDKLVAFIQAGHVGRRRLNVHLIDVSPTALAVAARTLGALDEVEVATHLAPYEEGLSAITGEKASAGRTLALFLGSNLGNFDPPGADAFLRGIRAALAAGDGLLVGADLVKPEAQLLAAYDDPLGVTAAFNRNLLVRINRELDGDVDIDGFEHRAVWNSGASRVEMHLVSRRRQRVRIAASDLDFTIDAGETIWTESSYKYRPEALAGTLERCGFRLVDRWIDAADDFMLTLVRAV